MLCGVIAGYKKIGIWQLILLVCFELAFELFLLEIIVHHFFYGVRFVEKVTIHCLKTTVAPFWSWKIIC